MANPVTVSIMQPLWFVQTVLAISICLVMLTAIFAITYALSVKKLK